MTAGCKYIYLRCLEKESARRHPNRNGKVTANYIFLFFFLKDYNKRYVVNHSLNTVELAKMMLSP